MRCNVCIHVCHCCFPTEEYSDAARSLAALTGLERSEWAAIHSRYFNSGINKESIETIESAQFNVCPLELWSCGTVYTSVMLADAPIALWCYFQVILETHCCKKWSDKGKYLLHGDGGNIWFDKSFNIIVFSDGSHGLNTEHSWGDAPVIGHVSEHNLTNEWVTNWEHTSDLQPDWHYWPVVNWPNASRGH